MKSLYLLAVLPPEHLRTEIDDIRKECSEKFKVYKALRPPVHITLYRPFWLEAGNEKGLINSMAAVGNETTPFTQMIAHFARFGSRVVYINAVKNPRLMDLQEKVVEALRQHRIDTDEKNADAAFHPHFTIAYRDLTPDLFNRIWNEYKERKFERQFQVHQFSILKHNGNRWNILKDFSLGKTDSPST